MKASGPLRGVPATAAVSAWVAEVGGPTRLVEHGNLRRLLEVCLPGGRFLVEYDGRGFGYEQVSVNGALADLRLFGYSRHARALLQGLTDDDYIMAGRDQP